MRRAVAEERRRGLAMAQAGVVMVSRERWADQLAALDALSPGVVRVQLYYDGGGPAFTAAELDQVRARLAPGGTLILRLAETAVATTELRQQLTAAIAPDGTPVHAYALRAGAVLELGNEPDRAGLDPYQARWRLLNGLPVARGLCPGLTILAALPTSAAGAGYWDAYLSDTGDGLGSIPARADGLALHVYGANTLEDSDALGQRAWLARALAPGKPVWITEAGIDEPRPWADRAVWYARFVAGLPPRVPAAAFFLLDSADPQWGHYRLGLAGATALRAALDAAAPAPDPAPAPPPAPPAARSAPMGHVPQPPITNHITGIPPKVDGVGVDRIGARRRPGATILHSMVGTLKGTDGYFPRPDTQALTDFGIGQTNHQGSGVAQIVQWCDIHGDLVPWASGPVGPSRANPNGRPEGDGPRFLATFGGPAAVNTVGVAIEHDDTTRPDGSIGTLGQEPVSVYQWSATCWLQAWLHAEVFGQTADSYDWNLFHREICGSAYKLCPGARIADHVDEYQAAVKAIMRHFQEGAPYPAGGLVVAGLRLTLPPEAGAPPAPPADRGYPGIVQPDRTLALNGAAVPLGIADSAEVIAMQVRNDAEGGKRYWIVWRGGKWEEWHAGALPLP